MTISSVSGSQITFTGTLVYDHYGNEDTYHLYLTDGVTPRTSTTVNLVAEVGLLTRNVKFQGADAELSQYGAHIMLSSVGDESSKGRIEFVEFKNVGQAY